MVYPFTPSLSYVSGTLIWVLLFLLPTPAAPAQPPAPGVRLADLPDDGFLLKDGWKFQPGNNPHGASPQLNDAAWSTIDPTKDIRELPQLKPGRIGWLRLHLRTGADLPPLLVKVYQSVASEVYVDGRLLYRFGTISTNPDSIVACNPLASFVLPLQPSSDHLLAIRVARQPGDLYNTRLFSWYADAIQLWVIPSAAVPILKPVAVTSIYLITFRIGIAFILLVLHVSLFLAYPAQRTNLYAAGMYLLIFTTMWTRAANDFVHSMGMRIVVHYGAMLDVWVPALALLTFYHVFGFRKGWLLALAIGSIGLKFVHFPANYHWLSIVNDMFLPVELARLSVVAVQRNLLGARIVLGSAVLNLVMWTMALVMANLHIPEFGHEWFFHLFYLVSFLIFPLALSLRLALEHGWVNRQLMVQLQEVESLSARSLAQQHEQQQFLARQNDYLAEQVSEQTYELHQHADQLRELDEVKTRFFSNITHEFRTPLSLIIGPVDKMLQENRFDQPLLITVQRNAGQLLRLINQLLDLSKLEGKAMAISLVQGNVAEFVRELVAQFQPSAEQKGVALTYTIYPLPPQAVAFDADKWEKILINLLANAVKFTASGGKVRLHMTPVLAGPDLVGVQLELADSGIGIAADVLPHIFDRFYQADTSSTRAFGGTGIGLSLVNELVDLLGGTITTTSTPGVGTTFCLTLPVRPVTDVPLQTWTHPEPDRTTLPVLSALAKSTYPAASHESRPCLLIVEDNDDLRTFLAGELSDAYQIMQVADGEEGWALAQAELPDIVLTDVMMPGMDGHELTRHIKSNPHTDHIAVVMLTARSAPQSRIDGLQQGADDYLAKPFSVAELQLRLHNLISRQQKLADYYRHKFALPSVSRVVQTESLNDATDSFLLRIYDLLDRHLDDPMIGVDWLAEQLAMNRKTLYRKVQSLIQLPPADLIRQYRLRRAAELLRSGRNVSETADLTGFSTASHLAALFRESYGQTPTEFMANRP